MSNTLRKIILIVCDIAIGVYLLLAVTAFNKPDAAVQQCREVKIDVEENAIQGFMNAGEIKKLLKREHLYPLSQPMEDVSPRRIEEVLRKSPFVEQGECYKTQSGIVCIQIKQRIPVIRVMADNGDNYYLDTHGSLMPQSRYVTHLMIATGTIGRKFARTTLTDIASQILSDPFWKDQVVQLNVLPDGSIEMVPRVGDHVVYLGAPVDIDKKLERLRKFYLYGLNTAGWNKYNYISVEFSNQIICKKNKRKK